MKARKSSPYGEAQSKPLALLIHGDAAFLGQGCSYENVSLKFKFPTPNFHLYIFGDFLSVGWAQLSKSLQAQMSKLAGFETSGSIHLITNNLIGFTAENTSAGSTFSVGDIGRCRSEEVSYTLKEVC